MYTIEKSICPILVFKRGEDMNNRRYLETLRICGLIDGKNDYEDLECSNVDIKKLLSYVDNKISRERLLEISESICDHEDHFESLLKMVRNIYKYKGIGLENFIDAFYYDIVMNRGYRGFEELLSHYKVIRVISEDVIGICLVLDNVEYKVTCDKNLNHYGFCLKRLDNGEIKEEYIKCIRIKDDKCEIYKYGYTPFNEVLDVVMHGDYDLLFME